MGRGNNPLQDKKKKKTTNINVFEANIFKTVNDDVINGNTDETILHLTGNILN